MTTLLAGAALVAVTTASCGSSGSSGSGAGAGSGASISVVSLGDSVASGEGIAYGYHYETGLAPRWTGGTTDPTWEAPYPRCHVTNEAYGNVVAASLHAAFTTFACTGSTYENGITGPRTAVENGTPVTYRPAQFGDWATRTDLNKSYDSARPDLVLVTLGADDVQFVGIVEACIFDSVADPTACTASNPGATVEQDYVQYLPTLQRDLRSLALAIRARGTAANPSKTPAVVFTTYPDPLPAPGADISLGACPDAGHLNANQIAYLSQLVSGMASVVRRAVAGIKGVSVADVSNAFDGHRFCSADPWAYGPSVLLTNPSSTAPFHPTPSGQRAVAAIVERSVPQSLRKSS